MSKNLIILTLSIAIAITVSVFVHVSAKSEPNWKQIEEQENKVGIKRTGAVVIP